MEKTDQYLMWMKRKQILKSHLQAAPVGACSNNSWEERAFAEDAARILGGCIWPPRSYSCSFCKREFRSAQALGGHMNVHRRDRARLKQCLSPLNEALHHHNNDCKSLLGAKVSAEISSQVDSCVNPYSSPSGTVTTGSLSPSRLSVMTPQQNCAHHTTSPYASSFSWGQQKGSSSSEPEEVINPREEDLKGLSCGSNHCVETDLSVGLNSMFGQKSPTGSSGDEAISCKRSKTCLSSLPVFLKPCSKDRLLAFQSAEIVLGLKPGMQDLDLELRLGKPQKV